MNSPRGTLYLGVSAAVVVAAVATGLFLLGSPKDERARRIDNRRVADLQGVAAAIDLFWSRHSRLPASLEDLTAEPGVKISTADPSTLQPYEYRSLDSARYEVCADFERTSQEVMVHSVENSWAHGAGRQCFSWTAQKIERIPEQRP